MSFENEEKSVGSKLAAVAFAAIDIEKLAVGVLDEVLKPALQKVVDDSANKFDDAAMAMIYPTLDAEIKKLIHAEIEKLKAKF